MSAIDDRARRIRDAEGTLDSLREALALAGITLPSLRLHPSTWSDDTGAALVDLGPCNLDTAQQIAAAVRKATA
ncbi:hypothetical protein ACFW4X_21145 [Streptomyces smyrnaeus]|uniref:hypothetical protein n=1 Tax=Streptomyces smyrnaeus TaxID=1387713 RepID=UPI0036B88203